MCTAVLAVLHTQAKPLTILQLVLPSCMLCTAHKARYEMAKMKSDQVLYSGENDGVWCKFNVAVLYCIVGQLGWLKEGYLHCYLHYSKFPNRWIKS